LRAFIVVDLGFGDAGKGLLTDYLARHFNAGVVVRYNGGAQAGHNVIAPDGRQHTFSQFGSATFIPGVKTYLSSHVVVHPTALLVEGDILVAKGVRDAFSRIRISEQALIITPFHQAANHIREIARGEGRHGSCGVGVGEAVEDSQLNGADSVLAGDLSDPARLRFKLNAIREQKRAQLIELYQEKKSEAALAREWQIFEREDVIDTWIATLARVSKLGLVAPDALLGHWLNQAEAAVFEGAQGILLDAEAGFHPFTTWSRCTAENALELIQALAPGSSISKIGVMRCYAVRHGPGPLPTETDAFAALVREHNQYNEWQGQVRYGWWDAVLARYALDVAGKLDALAVTHLDMLPRLLAWKYCPGYREPTGFDPLAVETTGSGGILQNFRLPDALTLEQRTRFTQALAKVTPLLETGDAQAEKVVQKIEALIGQRVGIISCGPSAEHVRIINAMI
jgi:adenylosuccinate synthase